jgi:asparagine synthase (glutamine-hydrolysing)
LLYGNDFTAKLNGMFAAAIWDEQRRMLLLLRDRLGVKPLYYAVAPSGELLFASEPKSILAYPGFPRRVSWQGIASYLEFRYAVGNLSMYEGIQQLLPGHMLEARDGKIVLRSYWDVPLPMCEEEKDEREYLQEVHEILESAVALRMIADVPICSFLSGGLDSSIVAGLMTKQSSSPIMTYSVGFPRPGMNEFAQAKTVASWFGTDHTEVALTEDEYLKANQTLVRIKDSPLAVPNEVAIYIMSVEVARRAKVVLSGEGADELFGGYGRIMRSAFDFDRIRLLQSGDRSATEIPAEARPTLIRALERRYMSQTFNSPASFFLMQYSYLSQAALPFLTREFQEVVLTSKARAYISGLFDQASTISTTDQFLWVFEKTHLPGLLSRLDSATMGASIEARGPFLDYRLVEFAMRLPVDYKMRWRSDMARQQAWSQLSEEISDHLDIPKYILRRAYSEFLPMEIVRRPKEAFFVPLEQLHEGPYIQWLQQVLLDPSIRSQGIIDQTSIRRAFERREVNDNRRVAQTLWMMCNLEMWLAEG